MSYSDSMKTVREFIDKLGGVAKASDTLGVKRNTLANWLERGIPAKRALVIHTTLKKKKVNVTLENILVLKGHGK